MHERTAGGPSVTSSQLRVLAGAVGVELGEERAATLVPQAEQHFALLRGVDAIDTQASEPAAEFHLDDWRRGDDA